MVDWNLERVIEKVVPRGRVVRVWALKGGIVAEMCGVEVEDGDGLLRKLVAGKHGRGDLTAAGIGAAFGEFVEGALVDL